MTHTDHRQPAQADPLLSEVGKAMAAFIRAHPGCTQREVMNGIGIGDPLFCRLRDDLERVGFRRRTDARNVIRHFPPAEHSAART
jgi:hypothetical protein